MEQWSLEEAVAYYKGLDAPQNQQALVELLRETQENNGGVLPESAVTKLAALLAVKRTFLDAVIKRYPSLRFQSAPHLLEVCGGPNCAGNGSARLLRFIAKEYGAKNGEISVKGGFTYKICGCMKQCGKGPNLKWDGKVYNQADAALVRKLINGAER